MDNKGIRLSGEVMKQLKLLKIHHDFSSINAVIMALLSKYKETIK